MCLFKSPEQMLLRAACWAKIVPGMRAMNKQVRMIRIAFMGPSDLLKMRAYAGFPWLKIRIISLSIRSGNFSVF